MTDEINKRKEYKSLSLNVNFVIDYKVGDDSLLYAFFKIEGCSSYQNILNLEESLLQFVKAKELQNG